MGISAGHQDTEQFLGLVDYISDLIPLFPTTSLWLVFWRGVGVTGKLSIHPEWLQPSFWGSLRPGADCGSDHELLIAKFRLPLKKVGKTTRPYRYDLNQNPYDYTVEVRNRFKGTIVRLFETPWTVAHQAPLSMEFSRPEYWSGSWLWEFWALLC